MPDNIYMVPVNEIGRRREPAFFKSRNNPGGVDPEEKVFFDFGRIPRGLVLARVTDEQHDELDAEPSVYVLPVTLDQLDTNIAADDVLPVANFLRNMDIPSGWINQSVSWRTIIKRVVGLFQFMVALANYTNVNPFAGNITLDTSFYAPEISDQWREWIVAAGVDARLAAPGQTVPNDWTVGDVLQYMAFQWDNRDIRAGVFGVI